MAETITLGSFCVNGAPVPSRTYVDPDDKLGFGDTNQETPIKWVMWNNLLVAADCLCSCVSWDRLNELGYIIGWPVKIDEKPYLCRVPNLTLEAPNVNDEWDNILNDLGEDNDIWHWNYKFFWGLNENEGEYPTWAPLRGYHSARTSSTEEKSTTRIDIGFRPILKPLPPLLPTKETIGTRLRVFSNSASVEGTLTDFSDYDMILEAERPVMVPLECSWAKQEGRSLIIDRAAITWGCICEEEKT